MADDEDRAGRPAAAITGRAGRISLADANLLKSLGAQASNPDVYCGICELPDDATQPAPEAVWAIDRFTKPVVTLINGPVTWQTFALVIHGTHRVADPAVQFSIGDVAVGSPPGLGASFVLAALPHRLGAYMALTGASIDAGLAYRIGWLTHRVVRAQFAHIRDQLAAAEPVDAVLDALDLGPAASALDNRLETIEHCFSAADLAGIITRLETATGPHREWARDAAAAMRTRPPEALAATHRLLAAYAQPTLRDGLIMDSHVARNWQHGERDDGLFRTPPEGDLSLPIVKPPSIG